jgi:hypothetical protein
MPNPNCVITYPKDQHIRLLLWRWQSALSPEGRQIVGCDWFQMFISRPLIRRNLPAFNTARWQRYLDESAGSFGIMARAGPVSSWLEVGACPLRQLQKTQGGWGASVSTA